MLRLLCVQVLCIFGAAYADSLGYNYDPLPNTLDGLSNLLGAFPIPNAITYNNLPRQIRAEPSDGFQQAHFNTQPTHGLQAPPYADAAAQSPPIQTEFISYTAPENYYDSDAGALHNLAGVLRPQRVVFIRSPETNIFSMTAKQLAQQHPLAIYVLARQTNAESLAAQFHEIQAQNAQTPQVHFVKYRTAADLARAQQTIRADYEQAIAGPSSSYEEAVAPVIDLRSMATIATKRTVVGGERTDTPVIFKLLSRTTPASETYKHTDVSDIPSAQYLPPRDY